MHMETAPTKENVEKIIYVPMASPMDGFAEEEEINLLELWDVVWQKKWFIMGVTLICTLIAVYWTLFVLPVTYKSTAVILPNKTDSSAMSRLSGLVGNLPLPISLPGGGKIDRVGSFLKSRTLQKRLLEKYDLLPRFYPDIWDNETSTWLMEKEAAKPTVVKALQTNLLKGVFSVDVDNDKQTGLISLSWIDEDPAFSALMLGRVIAELQFYLDNEYETDAARERRFVEQQLADATRELEYWEEQTPSKEMRLAKIQRERLATQTVYAELRKQLELAKITEAREVIDFKILDAPFVPENRFKPQRSKICLLTIIVSGMFSVSLVFGHRYIMNIRNHTSR